MSFDLLEDQNCFRAFEKGSAELHIDAKSYFEKVWELSQIAENSIYICGWDIHSQVELIRNDQPSDYPKDLAGLLEKCLQEKPELEIFILIWDFASFYTIERELFSEIRFNWYTNKRLHFIFKYIFSFV